MPSIRRRHLAALPLAGAAHAQGAFPERQIRFVVGFPPAGTADILSRILAERLAPRLGMPIIVENRAGAGGSLAAGLVAQARGDRHVVMVNNVAQALAAALFPSLPYDAHADFTHVGILGALPMVVAVNPAPPARTIQELLAIARAEGPRLTVAYGGNATASHLIGITFHRIAGIEPTFVPYSGAGPALVDVLAGNVAAIVETLPAAIGHIRAGRLRALAVSSAQRSIALPEVPNFAELGLGEATAVNWFNVFLPPGIPAEIVARWVTELRAVTEMPEVRRRFLDRGLEGENLDPAAAGGLVRNEITRWRDVVRANRVQAD